MLKKIVTKSAIVVLFVQANLLSAQTLNLNHVASCSGATEQALTLKATGFNNLGAITLYVDYDSSALSFNGASNFNPALSGLMVNKIPNKPQIALAWSASNNGISLANDPVCELRFSPKKQGFSNVSFNALNSEIVDFDANLIISSYVNGSVDIFPVPAVSINGLNNRYCLNDDPAQLIGLPAGGQFSGSGIVNNNTFIAAIAQTGTKQITYTYTDNKGCTNSATANTLVMELPEVSFSGLIQEYCPDAENVELTGYPAGGVFIGDGISGNIFSPSVCAQGPHTIYYVYTDDRACKNSASYTTTVSSLPKPNIRGLAYEYCVNSPDVNLIGTPPGGFFTGDGISNKTFSPSDAWIGEHIITYTYTNFKGCTNRLSVKTTVRELPNIKFTGLLPAFCLNANPAPLSASPSGGVFRGDGIVDTTFYPYSAWLGDHNITYTYTDDFGCTNSIMQTTYVNKLPVVSFTGLLPEYCPDAPKVTLSGVPAGGIFIGDAINGNTFTPSITLPGPHKIFYVYTDENGCKKSASYTTTISQLPAVSINGLLSEYCPDAAPVQLLGSPAGGVFKGDGVVNSTFNPKSTTIGDHFITYTYTNSKGCTKKVAQKTVILTPPKLTYSGLQTNYCVNSAPSVLSGTPTGGSFKGDGLIGNTFYPNRTALGNHNITYVYTDSKGCTNRLKQTCTVFGFPKVAIDPTVINVTSGTELTLTASGADNYVWDNLETTAEITVYPTETAFYTVKGTNAGGCSATAKAKVNIVTDPNPLGGNNNRLKQNLPDEGISLYPNPTSSLVNVILNNSDDTENTVLLVQDIYGKEIIRRAIGTASQKSIQLDLNGFSNGVYYVQILSNTKQSSKYKLVKVN